MRRRRFELPSPFRHYHLKVARLPVSPPPREGAKITDFGNSPSAEISRYLFLKDDPEGRAFSRFRTSDGQASFMVAFYDAFTQRKAETPASFLSAETGFKYFVQVIFGNAFSGVADID